jgi:uncharacterized membrane protein YccC
MVVLIGCLVFLYQVFNRPDYSLSAALTVAVILHFSQVNADLTPLTNATLRFIEVVIGSVVAILAVKVASLVENSHPDENRV